MVNDEFIGMACEVFDISEEAAPTKPDVGTVHVPSLVTTKSVATAPSGGLRTTRLSDVEPEAISWLWPGYIPRGKLTLLVGDPKVGKSYVTLDLAARLTSGKPWPDGAPAAPPLDVLLLQAEDGVADTVRPRIDALGGTAYNVYVIEAVRDGDRPERLFSLDADLQRLRPELAEGRGLLIIDPLTAYLGKGDSYKDADVRRVLAPVARLADETGVAVVAVMHLTKNTERQALYRAGGSIAFVASARMVLAVAKDPQDSDRRLLMPVGSNIAGDHPALAFRIVDSRTLKWEGPTHVDVEQILRAGTIDTSRQPVKLDAAVAFLRGELAASRRNVSEIQLAAKGRHAWPTVERAKRQLGVKVDPRPGGGWLWSLPISAQAADPSEVGGDGIHHHHLPAEPQELPHAD